MRVVVVDDHPLFREGLAALLRSVDDVSVVATAADGVAAVQAVREHRPDVVVMDLGMPGMDGVEATRRVLLEAPQTGVVVLTMSDDDDSVAAAVRAGARGYLLKGADQQEVVRAIATVAAGGFVVGPALATRIAGAFAGSPAAGGGRDGGPFPELTAREREVLDLVAAGHSNAQIAAALFLAPKTVRNTVSSVLSKLQVSGRPQAIVRAREAGLGRSG